MPMNRVGEVLQAADAVLVHLKDEPIFARTIPSKIQAYMALGKPILVAVHGDAAELVRQAQCGVEATPGGRGVHRRRRFPAGLMFDRMS